MYYSAGLLSKNDIYPEHKLSVLNEESVKGTKEKKDKPKTTIKRKKKAKPEEKELVDVKPVIVPSEPTPGTSSVGLPAVVEGKESGEGTSSMTSKMISIKKEPVDMADSAEFNFESDVDESDGLGLFENMTETGSAMQSPRSVTSPVPLSPSPHLSPPEHGKKRKKRDKKGEEGKEKIKKEKGERKARSKKEKGPPSVKALIAQRRKLWLMICKKEISKVKHFAKFHTFQY